jgi:uncharacterized membrane-anchored protein
MQWLQNYRMRTLLFACLALLTLMPAADAKPPTTEEDRERALRALSWHEGESLSLPISHGTLKTPAQIRQLAGPDAATLWETLNGVDAPKGMEAALFDPKTEALVFYQKIGGGYIKLDDWDDLDADAMLKAMIANTEADNEKRKAAGVPALHIVGWLERPQLDRANNVAYWSFEARDEQTGPLVNSIALILARDGFEKLIWIGPKRGVGTPDLLKVAQANFAFPTGGRYGDFQSGDKVAEYGIAGLVAAVLGVKVASKLGLLALGLVFAKKLWFLILVPLAVAWRWLKRVATGNRAG